MLSSAHSYCLFVLLDWHTGTCEEYQIWKKENGLVDKKFDRWRADNTRPCPKCNGPIQKNEGCNHMSAYFLLLSIHFLFFSLSLFRFIFFMISYIGIYLYHFFWLLIFSHTFVFLSLKSLPACGSCRFEFCWLCGGKYSPNHYDRMRTHLAFSSSYLSQRVIVLTLQCTTYSAARACRRKEKNTMASSVATPW